MALGFDRLSAPKSWNATQWYVSLRGRSGGRDRLDFIAPPRGHKESSADGAILARDRAAQSAPPCIGQRSHVTQGPNPGKPSPRSVAPFPWQCRIGYTVWLEDVEVSAIFADREQANQSDPPRETWFSSSSLSSYLIPPMRAGFISIRSSASRSPSLVL
jgi:hypothetical protein